MRRYEEEFEEDYLSEDDWYLTQEVDQTDDERIDASSYEAYDHPNEQPDNDSLVSRRSRKAKRQNVNSGHRARYSARIDRFLNNGIIIVGVLLIIVLVIAFMI